jgi:hypothetical protein
MRMVLQGGGHLHNAGVPHPYDVCVCVCASARLS